MIYPRTEKYGSVTQVLQSLVCDHLRQPTWLSLKTKQQREIFHEGICFRVSTYPSGLSGKRGKQQPAF